MSLAIGKIIRIDNAAAILNDVYWNLVENYVRPLINNKEELANLDPELIQGANINQFKIISASELTIMIVRPFMINDSSDEADQEEKLLNAYFAWFVANIILKAWCDAEEQAIPEECFEKLCSYKEVVKDVSSDKILNFPEEHIYWLSLIEPRVNIPIMSNAQTWRLFYFCLKALHNNLNK